MIEGKGKDAGTMGALKVKLQKNASIEFKIGTGFTAKMRKTFWNKKNTYIGNVVTFGYKGLTAKGIPRHPAFMRLRSNKNM
jgi:DNA ligase-1